MPLSLRARCHSVIGGLPRKIGSTEFGSWPNTIHNDFASHSSQILSHNRDALLAAGEVDSRTKPHLSPSVGLICRKKR